MEQDTRAVRLMVAGGLGQRTCPRSRCAARQSQALAASRLRGPTDAAAAARRREHWQPGLRAAPARLSPPLHNRASPAPPSRTSAEGRGASGGDSPGPRREGRDGAGSRSSAHSPRPPAPPRPRGRQSAGDVLGLSGELFPDSVKGEGETPTSFHFPSSQVSHPKTLFSHVCLLALPSSLSSPNTCPEIAKMELNYLHPPHALSSFKASSFSSRTTTHSTPEHQCRPVP